jgi:REP element-mobilizing transposase RayT
MARVNRREVLAEGEIQVVHCVNRCVRRGFLCGTDDLTGQNYEHRRQWIRNRIEFLAGIFGIDVLGFSVMSNHLHVVLRSRPDVVTEWSDEDVARRW